AESGEPRFPPRSRELVVAADAHDQTVAAAPQDIPQMAELLDLEPEIEQHAVGALDVLGGDVAVEALDDLERAAELLGQRVRLVVVRPARTIDHAEDDRPCRTREATTDE